MKLINGPFVSIIVPVYNNETTLSDTIWSCLNQTMNNIEIICINDGSTDESLRVLREMAARDHRIRIHSTEHRGITEAKKHGFSLSRSEVRILVEPGRLLKKNACMKAYFMSKRKVLMR